MKGNIAQINWPTNLTTQFYNQHYNLQYYQLSNLTNGGVTAVIVIGQDKEEIVEHSKAPIIEG